jgi:hypothetical protein
MALANDLQTSGSLYGINFTEWKERMMATLRLQALDKYVVEGPGQSGQDVVNKNWDKQSKMVAFFISLHVNPEITKRVPTHELYHPWLLMQHLETISTSFRFLDLPPELRNQIYSFVLRDSQVILSPGTKKTTGYPVITKVSRQIRNEALELFYAKTTFELSFVVCTPAVSKPAQNWALSIGEDRLKQIRAVSIRLRVKDEDPSKKGYTYASIRFTLDGDDGLRIHGPKRVSKESEALLNEHEDNMRKTGKVMGIQNDGRSLLLALVTAGKIWENRYVRLKA